MFHQFGCSNCHHYDGHGQGPNLVGCTAPPSTSGRGHSARRRHVYASVDPAAQAQIVDGFQDRCRPTRASLAENDVIALISYIRALHRGPIAEPSTGAKDRTPAFIDDPEPPPWRVTAAKQQRCRRTLMAIQAVARRPTQFTWMKRPVSSPGFSPPTTSASACSTLPSPFFFFVGGLFALLMRLQLIRPMPGCSARDLQQALHHARHHHGLVLPDSRPFPTRWGTSSSR